MPATIPKSVRPATRPLILLTNDDGFFRETIQILFRRLRPVGDTFIVAPDREKSASSLAITLRQPLHVIPIRPRVWAVEGTPGDCIYFALQKLLPRRPDLVISGINPGPNLGQQDINYSGTVAGALQGTFLGVASVAVSMLPDAKGRFALSFAAEITRRVAEAILAGALPAGVTLNVNVPPPPVRGVKVTRLGWKFYDPEIIEKKDPRNNPYFWIGTGTPRRVGGEDTDVIAAHRGFISLTPLHTDMTAHHALSSARLRRIRTALRRGL